MLKNLVKCAAVMTVAAFMLPTATYAADNAFVASNANYIAEAKSKVTYYQTNDVDSNAEKSEVKVSSKEIPYTTITEESDSLTKGTKKVTQEGVNGVTKVTEVTKYVNGEVADVSVSEEVISEPVDEIILEGTKEVPTIPDSSAVVYSKVITMNATAYCPCSICCGSYSNGYTANGTKAGYGVAAVDTSVIPLGTKLYVEGYGYAVAADTGGAIKGNRIDLCYGSHEAALNSGFGHTNVKVYILE
ncbi:MAG: 3D domain-containing protein [Clostridia bacterium]|nr:3D domain-containing protein [Clostridia bacterium]